MPRKTVVAKSAQNAGGNNTLVCLAHSGMDATLISMLRHQKRQNGDIRETKLEVKELRKESTQRFETLTNDMNEVKVEAARASNLVWKATLSIAGGLILLLLGQVAILILR